MTRATSREVGTAVPGVLALSDAMHAAIVCCILLPQHSVL